MNPSTVKNIKDMTEYISRGTGNLSSLKDLVLGDYLNATAGTVQSLITLIETSGKIGAVGAARVSIPAALITVASDLRTLINQYDNNNGVINNADFYSVSAGLSSIAAAAAAAAAAGGVLVFGVPAGVVASLALTAAAALTIAKMCSDGTTDLGGMAADALKVVKTTGNLVSISFGAAYDSLVGAIMKGLDNSSTNIKNWTDKFGIAADLMKLAISYAISKEIISVGSTLYDFWDTWTPADPNDFLPLDPFIDANTSIDYDAARSWQPRTDPLAIDLDNDGIETISVGTIVFDYDGDGIKTGTGWVKGDDGLLVLDRNQNGTIDTGSELFGADTILASGEKAADGFAALRELDSNADGKFDSADIMYSAVKVWQDANQDGISQAEELKSLSERGIASINLNAQAARRGFSDGNKQTAVSGNVYNLDLVSNPFYREFTTPVPLTELAKALPCMQGSGMVRDLQEAASLSPALATMAEISKTTHTRAELWGLLDGMLDLWATTSQMKTSVDKAWQDGIGSDMFNTKLDIMYLLPEQTRTLIEGHGLSTPIIEPPGTTDEERAKLAAMKAAQTDITRYIGVLERFNGQHFLDFESTTVKTGAGTQVFSLRIETNSGQSSMALSGIGEAVSIRLSQAQVSLLRKSYDELKSSLYAALALQTRLKPYLTSISVDTTEYGLQINSTALDTMLDGLRSNDPYNYLIDLLELDTYAGGILRELGWNPANRIMTIINDTAYLDIVQSVKQELNNIFFAKNDQYGGYACGSKDTSYIFGSDSNDVLQGGGSNDLLVSKAGNDTLLGGNGADILEGGIGNDRLFGGAGNDIYMFDRGDGKDIIDESLNNTLDRYRLGDVNDRIQLGASISPEDVSLSRDGSNLIIRIKNTDDELTIAGWFDWRREFDNSWMRVESICFGDGTVWASPQIMAKVLEGTLGNDIISGYSTNDTIDSKAGNDIIWSGPGNDCVEGGADNDWIHGEGGDDTLSAGDGDDIIYGGDGNDHLVGGDGDDQLYDYTGNNIFDGGAGNDRMRGQAGNDIYVFGKGYGRDTISEWSISGNSSSDAILMNPDVLPSEAILRCDMHDNLILEINGTDDVLTVENWFYDDAEQGRVEEIRFADGTVWDVATIKMKALEGTEDDDIRIGYVSDDTISGLGGDDVLLGRGGNDIIQGGAGHDIISGDAGNDTIDGGAGNDVLEGGNGNDTFIFGVGSGHDRIVTLDTEPTNIDSLLIDASVSVNDLIVRRESMYSSDDMIVSIQSTGDSVSIGSWLTSANPTAMLDRIIFADGTEWGIDKIREMSLTGADAADTLIGYATADVLDGKAGNDTLEGGLGNDVYVFGRGYGQDTVIDYDATSGNIDTLRIKDALPSEVTGKVLGRDLCLEITGTEDRIVVKNWLDSEWSRIESVVFDADGTIWDSAALLNIFTTPSGSDDTLIGTPSSDAIDGGGGNDTIYGLAGDDTLLGGADGDMLFGEPVLYLILPAFFIFNSIQSPLELAVRRADKKPRGQIWNKKPLFIRKLLVKQ